MSTGISPSAPGSDEPIVISDEDPVTEPTPPEATSPRAAVKGAASPVKALGQKWDKVAAKSQIFAPGETDEPLLKELSQRKEAWKALKQERRRGTAAPPKPGNGGGTQQGPPPQVCDPDKGIATGAGKASEEDLPAYGCH